MSAFNTQQPSAEEEEKIVFCLEFYVQHVCELSQNTTHKPVMQ